MNDLIQAIERRRAIRRYTDQPVEEEKLQTILQAARLAPTWANYQCWKIVVVRDAATRQQISELSDVASAGYASNPARNALASAPVVLVVCTDPEKSGRLNGKAYYLVDAGIVISHILLTATSLGLGTCVVGVFHEVEIKGILGVPPGVEIVALTPLGYPDRVPNPRPRNDLSAMVAHERWG